MLNASAEQGRASREEKNCVCYGSRLKSNTRVKEKLLDLNINIEIGTNLTRRRGKRNELYGVNSGHTSALTYGDSHTS